MSNRQKSRMKTEKNTNSLTKIIHNHYYTIIYCVHLWIISEQIDCSHKLLKHSCSCYSMLSFITAQHLQSSDVHNPTSLPCCQLNFSCIRRFFKQTYFIIVVVGQAHVYQHDNIIRHWSKLWCSIYHILWLRNQYMGKSSQKRLYQFILYKWCLILDAV